MRFALLPMLVAFPAFADVGVSGDPDIWQGIWAADPGWCQHADQIGSHDPAPVEITADSIRGLENSCAITDLRPGVGLAFWEMTLLCQSEGETTASRQLLMLEDDDTLWRWYGSGAPIRFSRCEGP